MPIRKKSSTGEEAIEVPMSSMIDVVFLLLIYFIVTFREVIPEAHIMVNLPAGGPSVGPKPDMLEIKILEGAYKLNDSFKNLQTIDNILVDTGNRAPDTTVVIKVGLAAKTEKLVEILDRCEKAGLKSLNVLTLDVEH